MIWIFRKCRRIDAGKVCPGSRIVVEEYYTITIDRIEPAVPGPRNAWLRLANHTQRQAV